MSRWAISRGMDWNCTCIQRCAAMPAPSRDAARACRRMRAMSSAQPAASIRFATRADALGIAEMSRDFIEHGLGWSWTRERDPAQPAPSRHQRHRRRARGRPRRLRDHEIRRRGSAPAAARRQAGASRAAASAARWSTGSSARPQVAGVGRITLEARASNDAARAFYRRHGYAQAQLLPGYYGGRETSVRMVKDFGLSRTGAL